MHVGRHSQRQFEDGQHGRLLVEMQYRSQYLDHPGVTGFTDSAPRQNAVPIAVKTLMIVSSRVSARPGGTDFNHAPTS